MKYLRGTKLRRTRLKSRAKPQANGRYIDQADRNRTSYVAQPQRSKFKVEYLETRTCFRQPFPQERTQVVPVRFWEQIRRKRCPVNSQLANRRAIE